jgi:single-strand DNA-binding protein
MFNTTTVTVVGRLTADVETAVVPTGDKVANFRIACKERRYDKELGLWSDGDVMFVGVACWRRLADGVSTSLSKGDQVVVTGRLRIDEYVTKEGERKEGLKIDARAVGPDLAVHTAIVDSLGRQTSPDQLTLTPPPPAGEPRRGEEEPRAA